MFLASMTWHEFKDVSSSELLALLPLGSTEQHGSVGPLGTDFVIPTEMARRIEKKFPQKVLVLPTMPYGVCPYHAEFSGTIDIGTPALQSVLSGIATSLMNHGMKRFVFLNGHGGNDPAIESTCLTIYHRGGLGAILNWWSIAKQLKPEWGGGHGGAQEASVMKYLHPDWVNKEKNFVPEETWHLSSSLRSSYGNLVTFKGADVKIIRAIAALSKTGTFGGNDDSCAKTDGAWGREIFEGTTDYLIEFIEEMLNLPMEKKDADGQ